MGQPTPRFLALAALVLAGSGCGNDGPRVETETITREHLIERVRASGRIRPKIAVDVSSSVMGRIVRLPVEEGKHVSAGDTLVLIDPSTAGNRLAQARARKRAASAALATAESRLEESRQERDRQNALFERNATSESARTTAVTAHLVHERTVDQLRAELEATRAAVKIADYELGEVTIRSEIDGVVVRLNVEEGENVVTGTMNVPGTVLMTIADLSVMEAVVLVDETDIVGVQTGQRAALTADAFPDTTLEAVVTEVGNASADPVALGSQQSIDFKVVMLIETHVPGLRPDLSATAEITIAERENALAVPIRALTLRDAGDGAREEDGVFVLDGDRVHFRRIGTGITGERDFEVLRGLDEGEVIVTGPFETIRSLEDGDRVRVRKGPGRNRGGRDEPG